MKSYSEHEMSVIMYKDNNPNNSSVTEKSYSRSNDLRPFNISNYKSRYLYIKVVRNSYRFKYCITGILVKKGSDLRMIPNTYMYTDRRQF